MTEGERILCAGALTLMAACGGLAEDDRRLGLDAGACAPGSTCSDERRAGEERSPDAWARGARTPGVAPPAPSLGPALTPGSATGTELGTEARSSESAPRVGDACEVAAGVGAERVAVGDVVLERNGSCGAEVLCLMRAPRAEGTCETALGAVGACDAFAQGEVVPVPPSLTPEPPPADGVCSCRCDGPDPGEQYCACPADMTCRELIVSSGVNGAARAHLGSYCVH